MDCVEINGYKSIKKAKLELRPINILIGANGSGKSNFLSFFEFIKQIYSKNLNTHVALEGGVERFLHKGSKRTDNIWGVLSFNPDYYIFNLKKGVNDFLFYHEGLNEKQIGVSFYTAGENGLNNESLYSADLPKKISSYLKDCRRYRFHDTGKNSPFSKDSNIQNDIYYLYEDGQNIAAILYQIQNTNPIIYTRIVKIIQSVAPYFKDFLLIPNENGYIRLNWKDTNRLDYINGFYDFSDGTLRFIALTVLLMQPNIPSVLIIDEPELGLHPFAIAKLAGMLKSASQKNCQIIIATQSTDLISHFEPEDIITVDQINGESEFNRLDSESLAIWLEDYSLGDLWKRSIISGGQTQ